MRAPQTPPVRSAGGGGGKILHRVLTFSETALICAAPSETLAPRREVG